MKKLSVDFINEIVNEFSQKRFADGGVYSDEHKELLIHNSKETAYVFALCINKLIDDGYFKE